MIELLILACIAVAVLAALLGWQAHVHAAERAAWVAERRFLTDRVIARHVGEVVALEKEDTRKNQTIDREFTNDVVRPLIEGLS